MNYLVQITTGNYDETDYQGDPVQKAKQRMRKSGWWGNQSGKSPSDDLKPEDLSAVLQKKSGQSDSELRSQGVYLYVHKSDNQIYIGSAINESLLDRQIRHLNAAAYTDNVGQLDKFDEQLSHHYASESWYFYAIPMSNPTKIVEKEKELITQYNTQKHGLNA